MQHSTTRTSKSLIYRLCIVFIAIFFLYAAGISYAYLTASEDITSSYGFGSCEITVGATEEGSVNILNTGNVPCFIRAAIDCTGSPGNLPSFDGIIDSIYWSLDYSQGNGGAMYGYYYCKTPVMTGAPSPALTTSAKLEELGCDISDIYVYAECIQQGSATDYAAAWSEFTGE